MTAKLEPSKIEELASTGLTIEQVANNLGVSRQTFYNKAKENSEIMESYERGKAKGINAITNALFKKALQGNVSAQIFFLKCIGGWKENTAIEVTNTQPIELKIINDLKE